jgi:diguanylate cyclase (GGDEF)-like protein
VATTVGQEVGAAAVFEQVAEEVARLLDFDVGVVTRFESDGKATVLGVWTADPTTTVPRLVKLDGRHATSLVAQTGRAARVEHDEAAVASGAPTADVAAPITIAGKLWGAVGIGTTRSDPLPPGAEERVARFADLAATAISNAEAWQTLAHHATTDALTDLPNYRAFHARLSTEGARAQRHGRELSLILLDIDHFKSINDEHGHGRGDEVLAETAQRLTVQMRAGDLIARIGGEEFAWLLPETDATGAYTVAERARQAMERDPFDAVGTVTISAGVCSLEDSGHPDFLVRLADAAMYWAKDSGRNATCRYTEARRAELAAVPPATL